MNDVSLKVAISLREMKLRKTRLRLAERDGYYVC